jgi:hypothetical protein
MRFAPRHGHKAFYATAAQVLPLLLLALVFERRYFEREEESPATSLWLLALLTSVGGGGIIAFLALLQDDVSSFSTIAVLFGLTFGTQALIQSLFAARAAALGTWLPERLRVLLKYLALVGLVAIIVLMSVFDSEAVAAASICVLVLLFATLSMAVGDVSELRRRGDGSDD